MEIKNVSCKFIFINREDLKEEYQKIDIDDIEFSHIKDYVRINIDWNNVFILYFKETNSYKGRFITCNF